MPGVSVVEKGTSNGAVTDFDGNFKLNVSSNDAVLVFSFIGFKTMERRLEGKTSIEIFMEEDQAQLDEVVLVGYSEQRREVITGAVATVSSEELAKSPTLNVSNALTGRMPGVVATQNSGEPGYDGSTISIRGSNSFGDNSPLVVIDGIPDRQGGFSRLNPADIKDISVLKDASAAIYGARAANGVILVTTKRGKVGKTSLSYDYNLGFSKPTVIPDLANASQYAMMRNELEIYKFPVSEWSPANAGFMSDGVYTRPSGGEVTAPFSPEDIRQFQDGSDPWFHPDTDWFSETLKDWSTQSRHTLQITGGTEDLKILSTIGYQNQDAYYKKSATNYKQYDIRLNMDAKINDYITAKIGVLGRQEDRNYPTKPASSIFRMLMRSSPTQPAYWPNGMPGPDIEYGENPVVITTDQTGYDRDRRYYFQSNGQLDIEIPWVKGLKFTGTAAVDKYIQQTKRWEIPWYLYTWQGGYTDDGTPELVRGKRGPAEPNLNQGNQDQLNILLGGVLNFERKFGFHQINVLAGVNRETIRNDSFSAYRRYFISTVIDQLFAGGDAEKDNDGRAWERARLNYFGRVGYNYKEKYLAEFLWRYDGSYMFPEDSRYGFFPGVMIGWRVSEENFWKENLKLINFFKIRASYGQMGNDNIYYDDELQEYQYFATYGFSNYVTGSALSQTLFETRVPNTAVTWEVANNYNLGFDGRMWEGKVNFTLDLFLNKRSSILWRRNASVPQTTGMSLPAENIGEVENRGWDFQLGYNNQFGDLMFSASINGGYAKNKIVFWDEAPGAPQWQRSTGRMINAGLYYEYDGVFATQEEIDNNTIDYSAITNNLRPGDMKYRDYDGDGAITPDDQVRRDKTTQPTFQGGVNFNFQYKDFDLSVLFQGAAGGELRVGADESGSIGNYLKEVYDNRWTIDNPSSTHPRIADRGNQYYSFGNTYWLQSTDYLRLKNIELGYNLPQQLADKVGINNFRLYVSAYNLVTWTGMESFDPEAVNSIGQYYPQSKIINLGARINF
ncbi:MAG TPA: SusC/RagA family TonB-linked outer membrane protein [Zunongwangia profunda]|nr:SusC/RagA family TonB-linked outer membrane protein [Zunongwangia profunda]|tara:strand:- start:4995 stop:8027 length:3033 start_codon:yes stop_codon:yes gene_type:complete